MFYEEVIGGENEEEQVFDRKIYCKRLEEAGQGDVQEIVAKRWQELLRGTDLDPIDVHTPMWLWSRSKFV